MRLTFARRAAVSLALSGLLSVVGLGCKKDTASGSSGSASTGAARANPTLKVQLNWVPEPEFGGLYAAREGKVYERAGYDVEIAGGGPGSPVAQLVAGGQADFGIGGADDIVIARARGIDLVAVFGTFQTSPQGIMVQSSRNLAKLEDLKSGTLALEPGLPFGAFMKKKFAFPGVTLVPYDGGIAKFLADPQHAQQCYVTAEPIAVKKKGGSAKVFLGADAGFNPYANVVFTRGATVREKGPMVKAFVAATVAGWRAYLDDPAPANKAMAKLNSAMDEATFALSAEAQRPLVETAETKQAGLGVMTEARWATLGSQLVDLGIIAKAPPAKECFADVTK